MSIMDRGAKNAPSPRFVRRSPQPGNLSLSWLPKVLHGQPAAFNDAFECPDRDWLAVVHGDDNLSAVGVTPFLMAPALANAGKPVLAQHADYIVGFADWGSDGSRQRDLEHFGVFGKVNWGGFKP